MIRTLKYFFWINSLLPHGSLRYIQEIYWPLYELPCDNPRTRNFDVDSIMWCHIIVVEQFFFGPKNVMPHGNPRTMIFGPNYVMPCGNQGLMK
jgi:hypothetical protein